MTLHFLNQGTKYHIGNNAYSGSVDREFIDAYPVVGEAWAQPFTVSKNDIVEVIIQNLWGVDYGSQPSNIQVSINDTNIGQINVNRQRWISPNRCQVSAGQTYVLKIATYGPDDPDDFVFEGVLIQTAQNATATPTGQAKVLQRPEDNYFTSTYDTGKPVASTPQPVYTPQPVQVPVQYVPVPIPVQRAKPGCWAIGLGIICLLLALSGGGFGIYALIYYSSHHYDNSALTSIILFCPSAIIGVILSILSFSSTKKGIRILSILYCIGLPIMFGLLLLLSFRFF
jgi:hypothetical protein